MYLQNIVCVAPVLHSQIVRTNIVTNIDTHTNKHTGWKHNHLANAGDKDQFEQTVNENYFSYHKSQEGSERKLGLKQYAQPTIRYDTWYDAHDTIHSPIYLPFFPMKQRLVILACDQKHCTPPTTTACAEMMRSGYNNGGLLWVSRCSVFVMNLLALLEYIGR